MGFPGDSRVKKSTCQAGRLRFTPWVWKILWRRKWQPTPVFVWGIPRREETGGLQSKELSRVGFDLVTKQQEATFTFLARQLADYLSILVENI